MLSVCSAGVCVECLCVLLSMCACDMGVGGRVFLFCFIAEGFSAIYKMMISLAKESGFFSRRLLAITDKHSPIMAGRRGTTLVV